MPYEITIKKLSENTTTQRGEYGVIDKRPWTEREVEDARCYESREKFLERCPLKEVLGYRPEREVTKSVEIEVLKQTVDDLDLAAVIKAINKL